MNGLSIEELIARRAKVKQDKAAARYKSTVEIALANLGKLLDKRLIGWQVFQGDFDDVSRDALRNSSCGRGIE